MGLTLSKGQGRCQVKSGHQIKMLHECREAHVLCDICQLKFNGGIYFMTDRKRLRSGQFRSNFKILSFLTKPYLSLPVLSQDSKNVIYFHERQLEMPKVAFLEVTSSAPLPTWFLTVAQQNTEYCFVILHACVSYVVL